MKNFLTNLLSLYWWISVVVVGIVLNVTSAYIKTRLDRRLSGVSGWWRKRSEKERMKRETTLKRLKNNPHEQTLFAFGEMRNRLRAIQSFVMGTSTFGVIVLLFATHSNLPFLMYGIFRVAFLALGALFFFLGLRFFRNAMSEIALLAEASHDSEKTADESSQG